MSPYRFGAFFFSSLLRMLTLREGVDRSFDTAAEQLRDVGPVSGGLAYGVAGLGEGIYWVANTASFGYLDARHAGVQAFKRGEISYRQLEALTAAAAGRGAAVGVVNLALTAVTAGLAGPFLGAGATLGSKILFAGVTSGLWSGSIRGATSSTVRARAGTAGHRAAAR